jgi:ParB family chromosome partitioning protein
MSRRALGRGLDALFAGPATLETEVVSIDISRLDPSSSQPRRVFNEKTLDELARSIKEKGILQPLVVRRSGERFEIIAGERRWRAAQRAGLHTVTCVIKDVPDDAVLELSLIENIQRDELNPIEEASAYRRLIEQLRLTQEEVARRVGRDRSSVANSLRLLRLAPGVQKLVEEEKLSMGHARALLAAGSPERQTALADAIVSRGLSVRETERLIREAANPKNRGGKAAKASKRNKDEANILAAESKLSRKLGAPVRIRISGGKGVIEIRFSSSDDLTRIFDTLARIPTTR